MANEPASSPGLGMNDEKLLAEALASDASSVTVLIAAKGGAARQAAQAVGAAGGTVQYRDDALGYLRALVPTVNVRQLAANASVQAIDLDEVFEVPDPRPEGALGVIPQPAPDEDTPRNNPYMPTGDIGAAQFVEENPEWDGRGVAIGIVDSGVSLDHPSLTTTSTGEPKIVDWVTGTDPLTDPDPTWVNMSAQVSGASFEHGGFAWTAPAAGSYRIGIFDESNPLLGGEVGRNVNRDGDSTDQYGVLWNTSTNEVWVDADTDRSFADESPMTDYKVNRDIGWFGTDNPATAVSERMPFVVQTDG
ncbi:MAG TPA: serine protease, partial [Patescibacteria group bacterium]|nr:serine protease [Patescibacteria group bacterium]